MYYSSVGEYCLESLTDTSPKFQHAFYSSFDVEFTQIIDLFSRKKPNVLKPSALENMLVFLLGETKIS